MFKNKKSISESRLCAKIFTFQRKKGTFDTAGYF